MALAWVPLRIKTPDLCLEAVKSDGRALVFVPEALKTPELCLVAVKQNPQALRWVPEALRTGEIADEACQRAPDLRLMCMSRDAEAVFGEDSKAGYGN